MIKDPKLGKHSHNNRLTKEGNLLRLIREYRKMSLIDVAIKLKMKASDVDHFENGRRFYTPMDIELFLSVYDLSFENFQILLNLKVSNKTTINHYLLSL